MKRQIILLLSILLNLSVFGQEVFSPRDLRNDLDSLVYHIEAAHPNPYYRYSRSRFYKDIENAKLGIRKPMTYVEFYFLAQKLVAKLEDGHIDLEMPIESFKKKQTSAFPAQVALSINKPYIIIKENRDLQPLGIPVGTEILSINGTPSQKIVEHIVSLVTGETAAFRANYGAKYFDFYIEQLQPSNGLYKLRYLHKGKAKAISVKGSGVHSLGKNPIDTIAAETSKAPFKFEIVQPGTALMTLKDFIDLEKFKPFADRSFESLKTSHTKNLIVDLRDNLGGDSDVGDYLLQYLLDKPFSQYDIVLEKNSQLLKNRLLRHRIGKPLSGSDSVLLSKRNGSVDTVKNGTDPLLNLPNRFQGSVYVLINSQTFSSAADFAQAFFHYHRGALIGEETGGLILSFGDIVSGVLPHTKMPFVISSKLYLNIGANANDWHGVIPTIPAKSQEALKKALLLIK